MSINTRSLTAQTLKKVLADSASLRTALEEHKGQKLKPQDLAYIQNLSFSTLRWYHHLNAIATILLAKPFKTKDYDILALLLAGLCQIIYLKTPSHAAVGETVNAVKTLKKPWAAGLLNACLRRFLREQDAILNKLSNNAEATFSHPKWLIEQIKKAWPQEWQEILSENNQHPPLSLRVNTSQLTRQQFTSELENAKIDYQTLPYQAEGIVLTSAQKISEIPGYDKGYFSVQDGSAQLAAHLLDAQEGHRILDACAAPGGKTTHILELGDGKNQNVTAIDSDASRLSLLHDSLSRLGLEATVIVADIQDVRIWWDNEPFDRILLDAPCSGTGVIRRHPDIKVLRRKSDIAQLANTQYELLTQCWDLLKPGGKLVYATCSTLPQENIEVIKKFQANHPDMQHHEINAEWGIEQEFGRQILPSLNDGMDGFYYCLLKKE